MGMDVAQDFRDESLALFKILESLDESDFNQQTAFKNWTIREIIGHLHLWNWVAELSYNNGDAFLEWIGPTMKAMVKSGIREVENPWLGARSGLSLLGEWREYVLELSDRFYQVDPEVRVKWAGPDMKLETSVTARLMETWSHAQAIYDLLGIERQDKDYIQAIAFLGVKTFSWSFVNRGLAVPGDAPQVNLLSPSGGSWQWNSENTDSCIEGSATEFCQVVTQTRNVLDTDIKLIGDVAKQWMNVVQCFAGPPENPPVPGTRGTVRGRSLAK